MAADLTVAKGTDKAGSTEQPQACNHRDAADALASYNQVRALESALPSQLMVTLVIGFLAFGLVGYSPWAATLGALTVAGVAVPYVTVGAVLSWRGCSPV